MGALYARLHALRLINSSAIVAFVLLSTATVFAVRESRTRSETAYSTSLVVVLIDAGKLSTCLLLRALKREGSELYSLIEFNTSVPAILYTWQTQILLHAAKYLDSTTYQLLAQLKILTTAIFARLILKRQLSAKQYLSLIFLVAGTALAISAGTTRASGVAYDTTAATGMMVAAVSSGFAGIWTERCLKGRNFLVTNIQMSISSGILATFQFVMSEVVLSRRAMHKGLFFGFNQFTVVVVVLQIVAGLLIGLLLKHADSIVKNFAASVSLILTCVVDVCWKENSITPAFICALGLVIFALLMYSEASVFRCITWATSICLAGYAGTTGFLLSNSRGH
jgi:solute carrier family 35 (UDP-sugar transporter), member A1/2/3